MDPCCEANARNFLKIVRVRLKSRIKAVPQYFSGERQTEIRLDSSSTASLLSLFQSSLDKNVDTTKIEVGSYVGLKMAVDAGERCDFY